FLYLVRRVCFYFLFSSFFEMFKTLYFFLGIEYSFTAITDVNNFVSLKTLFLIKIIKFRNCFQKFLTKHKFLVFEFENYSNTLVPKEFSDFQNFEYNPCF
ncbi:hypothetical protein TorRG33x02_053970, partial [Trema orientale]